MKKVVGSAACKAISILLGLGGAGSWEYQGEVAGPLPPMSHQAALESWNPSVQSTWPPDAAMGARQRWEWLRPSSRVSSPGVHPEQSLQGQSPGTTSGGQEAKVMLERLQLSPELSVLREQRGQPALEGCIIETPLLPGSPGGFIVLPPLLPVNRVLLLFWQELPLPTQS